MLSLSLLPEEYVTIGGSIVVKVSKIAGGRCLLAIEADRSVPVVRGAVLERNGTPPPACVAEKPPRKRPRYKPDAAFRWNDDRERAVRALEALADRLGGEDAKTIRAQVERLVPAPWEQEVPAKQVSTGLASRKK